MKLELMERLLLAQILPREGGIVTLRVVEDLRGKLAVSQKEMKDLGITDNEPITKEQGEKQSNIDLTVKEEEVIVDRLKALDKQKKLNIGLIKLWDKIVEKK